MAPMTPKQVKRFEIGILALFAGQLILLAAIIWIALAQRDTAHEGTRAHAALCALQADLIHRVTQGEAFLRAHPNGAFGIPASVLQQSIANEQQTIFSLRALRC